MAITTEVAKGCNLNGSDTLNLALRVIVTVKLRAIVIGLLFATLSLIVKADMVPQTEASAANNFIASVFSTPPVVKTLWLNKASKAEIHSQLDYQIKTLRIRYWRDTKRTAWILDEIGKEQPITIGVVVNNGAIEQVQILAYRESRGGEVQQGFFTDQFVAATLSRNEENNQDQKNLDLNKSIDGITGATLSVRAVKKIATLALYLHDLALAN